MEQFLLKVAGKPFRCSCGCNVFHHPKDEPDIYECNACGNWYGMEDDEEAENGSA